MSEYSDFSSEEIFFAALGRCIAAWAHAEDHLFETCVSVLDTERQRAAIVYYRTPTVDARLSLADELVRTVLPRRDPPSGGHDHPDTLRWDEIRKEILVLLPVRNRLAHHPVAFKELGPVPSLQGWSMPAIASWYESHVSEGEKLRGRHEKTNPLTASDLTYHRVSVESIITQLDLFRAQVLSKY